MAFFPWRFRCGLTHASSLLLYFPSQHLREIGVNGCFVEFFGSGVRMLSIAERATIASMCPEYGALVGFFPMDEMGMLYLQQTGMW